MRLRTAKIINGLFSEYSLVGLAFVALFATIWFAAGAFAALAVFGLMAAIGLLFLLVTGIMRLKRWAKGYINEREREEKQWQR